MLHLTGLSVRSSSTYRYTLTLRKAMHALVLRLLELLCGVFILLIFHICLFDENYQTKPCLRSSPTFLISPLLFSLLLVLSLCFFLSLHLLSPCVGFHTLPPAPAQSSGVASAAPCCLVWARGRTGTPCCLSSRLSCSSCHWYLGHGLSHRTVGTPGPSRPAPEERGSAQGAGTTTGRAWCDADHTTPRIKSLVLVSQYQKGHTSPAKGKCWKVSKVKSWSVSGSSQASLAVQRNPASASIFRSEQPSDTPSSLLPADTKAKEEDCRACEVPGVDTIHSSSSSPPTRAGQAHF